MPPVTLSRKQFWAMLGTIIGGLLVIIGVVYRGLTGDIDQANRRIQDLQNSYNQALGAAAEVKDLLARSPQLEKTILDTYKLAIKTNAAMETQSKQLSEMTSSLGNLTEKVGQIQQRVDRIDGNLQRAAWILRPDHPR
jgi:methyl-accepting chemotaxis protein